MVLSSVGTPARATNTVLKLRMNGLLLLRISLVEIVIGEPNWRRPPIIVLLVELWVHSGQILGVLLLNLLRMDEPGLHYTMRLWESLLLTRVVCVGMLFSIHHHSRIPLGLEHHVLPRERRVRGQGT